MARSSFKIYPEDLTLVVINELVYHSQNLQSKQDQSPYFLVLLFACQSVNETIHVTVEGP